MDFRQAVRTVAILNIGYFFVEFSVGLAIGSVSMFADSVDFLEDASINVLILFALGWSARKRAWVGMAFAGMMLVPGAAALWTAWAKVQAPIAPSPVPLSLAGAGAMAVNFLCAMLLMRFREYGGSLSKAAFLSARNDVLANFAIVAAGFMTAYFPSIWPDLLVGLGIGAMNLDSARDVWKAARKESREAEP